MPVLPIGLLPPALWGSIALLGYTYAGYPLLLGVMAKTLPRPWHVDETHCPKVALIIAAWNEAQVIHAKLENALLLDYPRDRLQIWVASDGSDDETVRLARAFEPHGVTVLDLPRGGKTRTLNRTVALLRDSGEPPPDLLVFSDANVFFEPDALRKLTRNFADPSIGGVSADVRLRKEGFSLGASQGLYYRYERFLQRCESRIGSMIGADGGMYAIRASLFAPVPGHILNDDFVISMGVIRQGFRLVYEPEAVAWEESPQSAQAEFKRKIRVEQGNFQALFEGLMMPPSTAPLERFCTVSHKVLRWFGFVPLGVALGAGTFGLGHSTFSSLMGMGQLSLYLLAARGAWHEARGTLATQGSTTTLPYYFVLENLAAAQGFWRSRSGVQDWGTAARRSTSSLHGG